MGVAQLLKAMRARPGGDKRPKGPTGPHAAPHTGPADCLPGVAELRAAIAHPAVEADSERQRHVEVSSSTMTSAVAPLAADATTPPSFSDALTPVKEHTTAISNGKDVCSGTAAPTGSLTGDP